MNILYIDHYAGSVNMGMEFRPYYLSKEWIKKGYSVRIVAATFSHLRKENPVNKNDFDIDVIDGIQYQWIKTGEYQENGIARAKTMLSFVFKLYKNAKKIVEDFHPDVVISSSTYPLDSYAATKIAKIAKCNYIHEGHDIWPLTLTEIGGMGKFNPFVIMMGIAERHAYKKANHVVSVLPYAYEHMLTKGLSSKDKFTHIPNGISLDDWNNPQELPNEHKELFAKLHNEGKTIVLYIGGHALSNYLDLIIDSAAKTKDDQAVVYVLVGSGVEKDHLIKRANDERLQNIYFLPPVRKNCVPKILQEADILFICSARSSLYRFGVSMNKVYDYMMAAKPILYGVEAKNNDVLEAKCGLYFDANNIDDLVNKLYQLKNMSKEDREQIGKNGKTWVLNNCEYSKLSDQFLEIIEKK